MEDDLNFLLANIGSWSLVCNFVSTQLDEIWKTTSIGEMEDNLIFLTMEDDLKYLKIEDDLNFWKWKMTSFF